MLARHSKCKGYPVGQARVYYGVETPSACMFGRGGLFQPEHNHLVGHTSDFYIVVDEEFSIFLCRRVLFHTRFSAILPFASPPSLFSTIATHMMPAQRGQAM